MGKGKLKVKGLAATPHWGRDGIVSYRGWTLVKLYGKSHMNHALNKRVTPCYWQAVSPVGVRRFATKMMDDVLKWIDSELNRQTAHEQAAGLTAVWNRARVTF